MELEISDEQKDLALQLVAQHMQLKENRLENHELAELGLVCKRWRELFVPENIASIPEDILALQNGTFNRRCTQTEVQKILCFPITTPVARRYLEVTGEEIEIHGNTYFFSPQQVFNVFIRSGGLDGVANRVAARARRKRKRRNKRQRSN